MEETLNSIGSILAVPVAMEPSGLELVALSIVVAFAAVMKAFAAFNDWRDKK